MTGRLNHSNDKLGLAGVTYTVPEQIARPESALQREIEDNRTRHIDLQMQWNSWELRNGQNKRSGWPHRRRDENRTSQQGAADSDSQVS